MLAPSSFQENQILQHGAHPAVRKGNGFPGTPFAPAVNSGLGASCTPSASGGLKTPASGLRKTFPRAPLGDISNRKKPQASNHLPSKSAGAVADAELLSEMFGSSALSVNSAAICLFGPDADETSLPPVERATRHAPPTGPVAIERSGFDVEGAVADFCARPHPTFCSPLRSAAQSALSQPPLMVEIPSPAVRSRGVVRSHNGMVARGMGALGSVGGGLEVGPSGGQSPLEVELELSGFVARYYHEEDSEEDGSDMDLDEDTS